MLRPPAPAPVIIGPGTPISPQVWEQHQPRSPDFTVRTAGGPTQINLFWESLLEASAHIDAATTVFTDVRYELTEVLGSFGSTMGHLHWRIPAFQAQFAALLAGTAGAEQLLAQAGNGAEQAHQAYRDAETTVQTWFALLLRVSEHELVIEHLLSPNGDNSFAYDWMVTTGVISAGLGLSVLRARFPVVATIVSTVAAMEKHAGLTPALMGRNEQVLDPSPVTEFSHSATGSFSEHLENMADVSDHGDIAVSTIDNGVDEPVYAVYIPGIDVDGVETDQGRSPMSLVDALGNDSQHMVTVVEDALEAAGAPEGATVLPIGFSMGGSHVLNLASSPSFNQKYRVPAAATVGSPGQNKRVETDVKLTHFEDGRDPVPHALGERHQESTDRLSVIYDFQNPDSEVNSVLGSAHSLQHNVDAIRTVEDSPSQWLTPEEVEHLDVLREHLDGEVRTTVFSTGWRSQDDPDHVLPWEAESLEDLDYIPEALTDGAQEARRLGRQLPGRKRPNATPGTVDWDAADATGELLRGN